ncbi:MAG: alpha/beta hydrolase [Alphaproteobacteria bacterium]|nr:alpha/beta hydrolase [Alphaproteobacteria bacterium]
MATNNPTFVQANGIRLCMQKFVSEKNAGAAPLILIRGLGTQMIQWPKAFIDYFTQAGLEVIIFDNRDVGESQKLDAAGIPDIMGLLEDQGTGFPVPYGIGDMAEDVVGLMDALGLETANIFGMSLGGMVAQHLAFTHGARMEKVICVMSTSSDPALPMPGVSELAPPDDAADDAALIDYLTQSQAEHSSPKFPTPEPVRRAMATKLIARNFHPAGVVRQMAAAISDGSRVERLKTITVPFMVLHGLDDTLIEPVCGEHIAAHVPGALWRPVEGMGHDIGPELELEIGPDILAFLGVAR